ncbi:MAG: hypothetical protein HLUCCA08_04185 [Rhodobacteraceae bacterium HLUCCA08]|nr:MAG: hypothetical protein HLUCCA08_04185 [Rhodobacteraceae bacterium HLUCCA08]
MIANFGIPGLTFLLNSWTLPVGAVGHGAAIMMYPPLFLSTLSAIFG